MKKKLKAILKKFGAKYMQGVNEVYGPCIRYGINPFI